MSTTTVDLRLRPIRGLGHWRAVRQMLSDYPPGTDDLMDMMRGMRFPLGPVARNVAAPLYFARERGWVLRGARGETAAIIYLRAEARDGVGVVHVDDINVNARYRRQGLAQRLLAFADEEARRKGYRYVKLAVQVRNTPAVTLYRRLGYQEQHHRFFAADATTLASRGAATSGAAELLPLARADVRVRMRSILRAEREADAPDTAPVMNAYYVPPITRGALWTEAIRHDGQDAGFWTARRVGKCVLVLLGLLPALWSSAVERDVLSALAQAAGKLAGSALRLLVMSGAHHRALCAGAAPLAQAFGLADAEDERMIMVKVLPAA
jgi:ribosomal protein S18 acetylase RimI-like enzyme